MNTNVIVSETNQQQVLLQQTHFWLKIVDGWKREIGSVVERSETVRASSEVTAEVAKAAGELSLFAEKLDELYVQIGTHRVNLPVAETIGADSIQTHFMLFERLNSECELFRTLLSELFKLNKAAYKGFLC